jgi:hypothetical protein
MCPYFCCLQGFDQKRLYATSLHMKNNLGVDNICQSTFEKLRTSKRRGKNFIVGTPSYDILQSDLYRS